MCIIGIDFARGALKLGEARRALDQMRDSLDAAHVVELEETLEESELVPAAAPGSTGPMGTP
jgi:hypothetical protein